MNTEEKVNKIQRREYNIQKGNYHPYSLSQKHMVGLTFKSQ